MFKNLFSGARPKKPGAAGSARASRESLDAELSEEPVVKVSAKRASRDKSPRAKPRKEKPHKEKSLKEKKRSGTGASPFGSGLLLRRGSKERRRAEAEQDRRLQEDLQERDRILSQAAQEGSGGAAADADGLWEVPLDSSVSQTLQLNGHSGEDVPEGRPQSAYSSHSSSPAASPTEKEPPKKAGKGKKRTKDKDAAAQRASSAQLEVQVQQPAPLPPPPPSVTLAAAASRRDSSSSSSVSEPPQSPMGPRQPSVSEMVEKFEQSAGGDGAAAKEVPLEQKVSLVELKVQESLVVQQMRERQQRHRMEEFERSTRPESLYATVDPRNKKKPEPTVELPANAREELEKQAEDIVRAVREALEAEQGAFEERLQKRRDEETYRESRWKLAMETVDEEWRAAAERLRAEEQRLRGRREADLQEAVAEARRLLRAELDEERLQALAGARLALRQHAEAALRDQAEDVLRAADQMVAAAVAAALDTHRAALERQQEELDSRLSSVNALDSRLQHMEAKMAEREKQLATQAEALAELEVQLEQRSRQLEQALVRKEQQQELETKAEQAMTRLGRILEEEERAAERRSQQEQMWRVSLERLEAESRSRLERLESSEKQQREQWQRSLERREEATRQLREAVEQQEQRLAAAREQLAAQLASLQALQQLQPQGATALEEKLTALIRDHEARLEEDSAARKKFLREAEERLGRTSAELERKLTEARKRDREEMDADLERKLEAARRVQDGAQEQLTLRIRDYEALLERRREEEARRRHQLEEEEARELLRWRQDLEATARRLEEALERSRGRLDALEAAVGSGKRGEGSGSSGSGSDSDGDGDGGRSAKKVKAEVGDQVLAELGRLKQELVEEQRRAAEQRGETSRLVLEEMEAALVARIEGRLGEIQQAAGDADAEAVHGEVRRRVDELARELRGKLAEDIASQWKLERAGIEKQLAEDLEVKVRRHVQDVEEAVRAKVVEDVRSNVDEIKTAVVVSVVAEMVEEKWSATAKQLQKDIVSDVMEKVENQRKQDMSDIREIIGKEVEEKLRKTVDDVADNLDHKFTERLSTWRNDEREHTNSLVVSLIEERGKLISGEMDDNLLEGVVVRVKDSMKTDQDKARQELMEEWNETVKRSTGELRDKMEKEVSEEVKKCWKEDSNKIRKDLEEKLKEELKDEVKKMKKDVREDVMERTLSEVRENEIKLKGIIAAEVGTKLASLQNQMKDELGTEISQTTKSLVQEDLLKSKQQLIQDLEAAVREAVGLECGRVLATLSRHEQEARDRLELVCQELIRGQLDRLGRCCDRGLHQIQEAIEKSTEEINSGIRDSADGAVQKAQERLSVLELEAKSRIQSEYERLLREFQEECDQRLQLDLQLEEDRKREMEERKQRLKNLIENIFAEEESVSTENMAEALLEEEEAELERRLSLRGSQRGRHRPHPQSEYTLEGTERVDSWSLVQGGADKDAGAAPPAQHAAPQRPQQVTPQTRAALPVRARSASQPLAGLQAASTSAPVTPGVRTPPARVAKSALPIPKARLRARAMQFVGVPPPLPPVPPVGKGDGEKTAEEAVEKKKKKGKQEGGGKKRSSASSSSSSSASEGDEESGRALERAGVGRGTWQLVGGAGHAALSLRAGRREGEDADHAPPPPLPATAPPAPHGGSARPISYVPGRTDGDDKEDDGAIFV